MNVQPTSTHKRDKICNDCAQQDINIGKTNRYSVKAFEHVQRESLVGRGYHMDFSPMKKGRGKQGHCEKLLNRF